MEGNGWIKLHRKITDSAVFDNPELLKMWIWCLCKASHKGYEQMVGNQVVHVCEGQFVFGRQKASHELLMNESKVYRYINILEKSKMLNIKSNNKFSLITIEKWAFYQGDDIGCEQQTNNKRTTNEQQMNTNKNVKNVKKDKNKLLSFRQTDYDFDSLEEKLLKN